MLRRDTHIDSLLYKLKLLYSKSVIESGIKLLSNYMDTIGEKTGWLVIFNRNTDRSWDEKIFWKTETVKGKIIHIVGC